MTDSTAALPAPTGERGVAPGGAPGGAPGVAPGVAVIVVAAGSGTRLGFEQPKAFVHLQNRPVLAHALDSIFGMRYAVQLIVVAPGDLVPDARTLLSEAPGRNGAAASVTVVAGGNTRQASVDRGLAELLPSVEIVLVHDAARALTPSSLCDDVVDAVLRTGHGIVPGLPVVDTIKRIAATGTILGTVDRSELSAVQTPQGFPRGMLLAARRAAVAADADADMTDDAALVAAAGYPVTVIAGHPLAFKITTRDDLHRAEQLLSAGPMPALPRVGTGLDVHAFAADTSTELWLAGLYWPNEPGLSGHSDGDVAVHAICDALLGAAGLGDVGSVFGTADARFSGAHGDVFLRETVRLLGEAGFAVGNVSAQIIGNRPKFSPRRSEAEAFIGALLAAPVNLAATTTDALGFTGRGEGIAATAVALLVPVPAAATAPQAGKTPDLSWGM